MAKDRSEVIADKKREQPSFKDVTVDLRTGETTEVVISSGPDYEARIAEQADELIAAEKAATDRAAAMATVQEKLSKLGLTVDDIYAIIQANGGG